MEMCKYQMLKRRLRALQNARLMLEKMGDDDEVFDIDFKIEELKKALDKLIN